MRFCRCHCGRLAENRRMSRSGNEVANSVGDGRKPSQTNADRACAKMAAMLSYDVSNEKIRVTDSVKSFEDRSTGIAAVDYVPWPETGCSLGEARQRVADRTAWKERCERIAGLQSDTRPPEDSDGAPRAVAMAHGENQTGPAPTLGDIEAKIESGLRSHLANRQLVAYGRLDHPGAASKLIGSDVWPTLTRIDWERSSASRDHANSSVWVDVRVFPVLHAPCRVDLVAGRSFAEAFKGLVLEDPEVAALAKLAARLSPEFERVFVYGRCYVHGVDDWPMAFDYYPIIGTVHPDPAKRSILDVPRQPDPIEVIFAAEALADRLGALIGLLRRGELEAQGLPATSGHPLTILRSVWSHRNFHFNSNGDVFQLNYECKDPRYDRLTRRWSAVVLQRAQGTNAAVQLPGEGEGGDHPPADHADGLPSGSAGGAKISAADVVAAGTLADALTRLIFKHPEVQALRASAAAAAKTAHVLFEENAGLIAPVYGHNEPLLPLRFFRKEDLDSGVPDVSDVSGSDQDGGAAWDGIMDRFPQEISDCYGAINARAAAVFDLLQDRAVVGFGHTSDGHFVEIARTIWSHKDFYIHPPTGDIYDAVEGEMTRRWTGVVLTLPAGAPAAAMFHVKPNPSDHVRPSTVEPKPRSIGKAILGAEAREAAYRACVDWLVAIMRASPTERTESRESLWGMAQQKWPSLSYRSFLDARAEAIHVTGAVIWGAAGAPRKSRRDNRRTD